MTYIDLIATVTGHRVVVIPLLSIDHELEFRELFRNGLCFLRANFLTASEAGIRVLFLFVEGVLAEARAAHTRNRIIHCYDSVSDEIIWGIIINHLPILNNEVQQLLGE